MKIPAFLIHLPGQSLDIFLERRFSGVLYLLSGLLKLQQFACATLNADRPRLKRAGAISKGCRPAAGTTVPVCRRVHPSSNKVATEEKAHCLRGAASHASERTAASGWTGPRGGTCGVSRRPTFTRPSQETYRRCAVALAVALALPQPP